jgi:hypothetical protein
VVITKLERRDGLLLARGRLWGPLGGVDVALFVDTGAGITLIQPRTLAKIGYGALSRGKLTQVATATHVQHGYLQEADRLETIGFVFKKPTVDVCPLPSKFDDVDGLLGLSELDQLDYTIYSERDEIAAAPAAR